MGGDAVGRGALGGAQVGRGGRGVRGRRLDGDKGGAHLGLGALLTVFASSYIVDGGAAAGLRRGSRAGLEHGPQIADSVGHGYHGTRALVSECISSVVLAVCDRM
jgi:hypothetical protein